MDGLIWIVLAILAVVVIAVIAVKVSNQRDRQRAMREQEDVVREVRSRQEGILKKLQQWDMVTSVPLVTAVFLDENVRRTFLFFKTSPGHMLWLMHSVQGGEVTLEKAVPFDPDNDVHRGFVEQQILELHQGRSAVAPTGTHPRIYEIALRGANNMHTTVGDSSKDTIVDSSAPAQEVPNAMQVLPQHDPPSVIVNLDQLPEPDGGKRPGPQKPPR